MLVRGKRFRAGILAFLLFATFALTPDTAEAASAPPPVNPVVTVAPPVVGLCAAPYAWIVCTAAIVIGAGLIAYDHFAGPGVPIESETTPNWCFRALEDTVPTDCGDAEVAWSADGRLVLAELLENAEGEPAGAWNNGMGTHVFEVDGTSTIGGVTVSGAVWNGSPSQLQVTTYFSGGTCPARFTSGSGGSDMFTWGSNYAAWANCRAVAYWMLRPGFAESNIRAGVDSVLRWGYSTGCSGSVSGSYQHGSAGSVTATYTCSTGDAVRWGTVGQNNAGVGPQRMAVVICTTASGGHNGQSGGSAQCNNAFPGGAVYMNQNPDAEVKVMRVKEDGFCQSQDGTGSTPFEVWGEEIVVFGDDIPESVQIPGATCPAGSVMTLWNLRVCGGPEFATCTRMDHASTVFDDAVTDTDCLFKLGTEDQCLMWLEWWDGLEWQHCVPEESCVDWWTHPNRELLFRCGWGGNYYNASQCYQLRDYYNSDEGDVLDPDPEAPQNPSIQDGGDPVTVGGPTPPATARPNANWFRRIVTEWAVGAPTDMMGSCWPQGWGLLNPLQWVLRPILCALTWAFVPQQALNLEPVLEQLQTRVPTGMAIEIVAMLEAAMGSLFSPGGGCGYAFEVPVHEEELEVRVIPCPSEYGLGPVASFIRLLSAGVFIFGSAAMMLRTWNGRGGDAE